MIATNLFLIPILMVAAPDPQKITHFRTIELSDGLVRSVAISPDASTVAGCGNRIVQLFDVKTGEQRHRLAGHAKPVLSVAFTPDGQRLASSSADGTLRIWDVVSGRRLTQMRSRSQSAILSVAVAGDSRWMVSCHTGWRGGVTSERHEICLWDLNTGLWEHYQERFPNLGEELATHVAFSTDGKHVAVSGRAGNVAIYRLSFGFARKFIVRHDELHEVTWVAFAPNSKKLLSCGRDNTIRVWDVNSGNPLLRISGTTRALIFEQQSRQQTKIANAAQPT